MVLWWLLVPAIFWLNSFSVIDGLVYNYNLFQLFLWFSGVILTSIFIWVIRQRFAISTVSGLGFIVFFYLIYFYLTTANLLVLFIGYELFLLPSFLIVLYFSPNRRGVIASLYFLIWTQVGSFLVLVGVVLVYLRTNSLLLENIYITDLIPAVFFFFGFGVKVPIWPAHYWLTKTHVEAPTYFSIYLSGFLVNTALYGLWFMLQLFSTIPLLFFITVTVIGVLDSSLKMWGQVDLKKLVAYGTIQEMNLILLGLLVSTQSALLTVNLFILAHTILSTMFFLLVDCLYKRFSTRTSTSFYGLFQITPKFAFILWTCCLLFMGLPFTVKFMVEVYIFLQICNLNVLVGLVVIFGANIIGIIGFMYNWFKCLFGNPGAFCTHDFTRSELLTFGILILALFILGQLSVMV